MANASVIIENHTQTELVFGFYSAPHDHTHKHTVGAAALGGPAVITTISIDYPDARVIAAWFTDKNGQQLYPNNTAPFVTGGLLEGGNTYRVVLDTGGITFSMDE